ncbi:MAG: FHA domain-containing protein [Planctomycetaceae bacterium]
MSVLLEAIAGPGVGHQVQIRIGQRIVVGRSTDADLSVVEDLQLSSNHFSIAPTERSCELVDMGSTNGTLHNGQHVQQAVLQDGDQIVAGQTTFTIRVTLQQPDSQAEPAAPATNPGADALASLKPMSVAPLNLPAVRLCEALTLTDEANAQLTDSSTVEQFIQSLVSEELFADAIRVRAKSMDPAAAVLWASRCLMAVLADALTDGDRSNLAAIETWIANPTEANGRLAMAAAEASGTEHPSSMLAMAAYWSGGNVAPPGSPPITPDPQLPSQAITGGLMLLAVKAPESAADTYRSFLNAVRVSE